MAAPKSSSGKASFLRRTTRLLVKALKGALTPSLVSYFFWCGLLSCCIGFWSFIEIETFDQFLCTIPAQYNESEGQIVGCDNCKDTLLMCDKSACWREAVNLTYQLDAKVSDDPYYNHFQQASLDTVCNQLVFDSNSPASMLDNMIMNRQDKTSSSDITESCLVFHCRVFMNALNHSDLAGPAPCTDLAGVKPAWAEDECTCSSLSVSLAEALRYRSLCGGMAANLLDMTAQRITNSRPQCLRDTLRAAAAAFPNHYHIAAQNLNCSVLLQAAATPGEWFQGRQEYSNAADSGLLQYTWLIPDSCDRIMCTAFLKSLSSRSCQWESDETLQSLEPLVVDYILGTACARYSDMRKLPDEVCSLCQRIPAVPFCVEFCGTGADPTVTGNSSTNGASSTSRAVSVLTSSTSTTSPAGAAERRRLQGLVAHQNLLEGGVAAKCEGADVSAGSSKVLAQEPRRRLQEEAAADSTGTASDTGTATAAAPSPSTSATGQDWALSQWSQCTCLQQCVSGVMVRSVTCPAGVTCKDPKPSSAMSCICAHCANCSISWTNWAFFILYTAQGGLSLLMWLAFWKVSMLEEDDLSDMRCATKCLGFFCKFLPVTLRVFTYGELIFVIYVFFVVVIPLGAFESDCRAFSPAVAHAAANLGIWLLQLAFGIYMKRNKPMPPWLYNAVPDGIIKILCAPIRAIGP